jgi:hypothetical protein
LKLNPLTSNESVAFDPDRWLAGAPKQDFRGAWYLGETPDADGGLGFLTASTLMTALTGWTADIVDEIELFD